MRRRLRKPRSQMSKISHMTRLVDKSLSPNACQPRPCAKPCVTRSRPRDESIVIKRLYNICLWLAIIYFLYVVDLKGIYYVTLPLESRHITRGLITTMGFRVCVCPCLHKWARDWCQIERTLRTCIMNNRHNNPNNLGHFLLSLTFFFSRSDKFLSFGPSRSSWYPGQENQIRRTCG